MEKETYEKAYQEGKHPWTTETPPEELSKLVESGEIKPGKALDIGCGEGFYSIYLAKKGFEVTGIDISPKAIEQAKANAEKHGVKIDFRVMDLRDLLSLEKRFDFVLEWAILHILHWDERERHVKNVASLLKPKGRYLVECFNVDSPAFGQAGKRERQESMMGSTLYFSSTEDLKELYSKQFRTIESKMIEIENGMFKANVFFMEKE